MGLRAVNWSIDMILQVPVQGYFGENTYFYIDDDTKHGFLIDPGAQPDKLLNLIKRNSWKIEKILLTHGHFDHTGAVAELREALGVPVYAYRTADEYLLDPYMNLSGQCGQPFTVPNVIKFSDGEVFALKANPDFKLKAVYTPGHTTDSVTYVADSDNAAFVGDTIFLGALGNPGYPGGDTAQLRKTVIDKIFTLPSDMTLYSGHTDPTTVGAEMRRYQI